MKTEITRLAVTIAMATMVAVPSITRGLNSGACGKERKEQAPRTDTSWCFDDGSCRITTFDPPEHLCGYPAAAGQYCQDLDEDGLPCTQNSWMTIEDGVCLGQWGAYICIDVNNEPWWACETTVMEPCYEGIDFELCPGQEHQPVR